MLSVVLVEIDVALDEACLSHHDVPVTSKQERGLDREETLLLPPSVVLGHVPVEPGAEDEDRGQPLQGADAAQEA